MQHRYLALAFVGLLTTALPLPSRAQTVMVPAETIVSIDAVRDLALDYGIDRIESIELNTFTGRWEVEGTDLDDRDVDMEVDATTGAVVRLER